MSEALRHLLPADLAHLQAAAVTWYLLASSSFSLAAGITLGWVWGRR